MKPSNALTTYLDLRDKHEFELSKSTPSERELIILEQELEEALQGFDDAITNHSRIESL